jgi:hypothetical protein
MPRHAWVEPSYGLDGHDDLGPRLEREKLIKYREQEIVGEPIVPEEVHERFTFPSTGHLKGWTLMRDQLSVLNVKGRSFLGENLPRTLKVYDKYVVRFWDIFQRKQKVPSTNIPM